MGRIPKRPRRFFQICASGLKETVMDILLIEDNPGDIEAIKLAFKQVCPGVGLQIAEDGEKAEVLLSQESLPKLILLDLNLPGRNGREVLAWIKRKDSRLSHIPVIILTTSQSQIDICETYKLQASCYLAKPFGFEPLLELVRDIYNFWLKKVLFCTL